MLDLRRLAILHQFSVSGSITATAEAMGYSPSAISQQLTTLERETGAVLLERTARSATLTDAGRLLARRARTLMAISEAAEAELAEQLGRISGSLTITTIPSLAAPVASALAELQREHRGLEIVMRQTATEPAAIAVADHLSDLAVADDWSLRPWRPPEGLKKRKVYTEAVVLAVYAGHPLAGLDRPLTAREFSAAVEDMTWLCTPRGQGSRLAGDERLREAAVSPRRRWEFEGLRTIAELVADGSGCALLPETVAMTQPADHLHVLRLTPVMTRHVHLLTRASTTASPTVAACVTAIMARLRAAVEAAEAAEVAAPA
jgi:DNA-binding transcriptional LysR family regulator